MTTASTHTLPQWIDAVGLRRLDVARALGVAKSTITRICTGERRPSHGLAVSIEIYTLAAVRASSFGYGWHPAGLPGPALLRKYRFDTRQTVSKAAKAAGVAAMSWRGWENGNREPSPAMLDRLSAFLGVPVTASDFRG